MSVNELNQKKLINEFNRKLEGENPDTLQKNSNIPEDILKFQSIEGIVTDPENRTLWINGMPYGNAYATASKTATENGPFHAEVFNDFETNTTESDYSHVEGQRNTIESGSTSSHAEGIGNIIYKDSTASHVEGIQNKIFDDSSVVHVEGIQNTVNGNYNHVEGSNNKANFGANYIHSEGFGNEIKGKANYSHIEGFQNEVFNEYEHAEGVYNFSQSYVDENGGDEVNDGNAIISSIGVGISDKNRKNAIRVNKDGSVYLGSIIKRTDRVTEVFDPCNYTGQSIYDTNRTTNTSQKLLKSTSVQELLSNINHSEQITYWRLRKLAESGKLLPGKSYRITDYNIGINPEYNTFENNKTPKYITSAQTINKLADNSFNIITNNDNFNRFDIIVTAVSTTEFSDIAKACAHDFYGNESNKDYFLNTDFNSWQLNFDFFNSSEKYPWINTKNNEPIIKILPPALSEIERLTEIFKSYNILKDNYIDSGFNILSKIYFSLTNSLINVNPNFDGDYDNIQNKNHKYFELTSKSYTYANEDAYNQFNSYENETSEPIYSSIQSLKLDANTYTYQGSYYYLNNYEINKIDYDHNIENNHPELNNDKVVPPTEKTHHYNYKWILNNESNANAHAFEFCLLTNEADFSYMKTNGKTLETNILFCKNDKQIDVTEYNGENEHIIGFNNENNTPIKDKLQYYEFSNNYPYILQVERGISGTIENESGEDENIETKQYSAFIYDGPYKGNFGQLEEPYKYDLFYILENYDPKENIYSVSKDTLGSKLLLIPRKNEISDVLTDYSDFSTIQNNYIVKEIKYNPASLENNNEKTEYGVHLNPETKKLEITIYSEVMSEKYPKYEESLSEYETFYISNYTYVYEGLTYAVWIPSGYTNDDDLQYFLISNKSVTDIADINENNVTDVVLIICPDEIMYANEWGGQIKNIDILEYNCTGIKRMSDLSGEETINIYDSDGNIIDNITNFQLGNYKRKDNSVFQNERYYVLYEPLNGAYDYENSTFKDNVQYRVLTEHTLNMKYEVDSTTNIKDNLETKIYLEETLLPICYVNLDITSDNYFKEGKFENTGTIYRLIDEFGNDAYYDFKNIKIYNGLPKEKTQLAYSYTFDGVIKNKETIEEIVYVINANGKYYDSENNEYDTIEGNEDKLVTEKDELGNTKTEIKEIDIENPYEDYRYIGDKSILGSCINNKIYSENENGVKTIPSVFFRMHFDSTLINNTYINCTGNTGSNLYEEPLTSGSLINFSNNIFKECENLDIVDYSTVNGNYFYKCSGSLTAKSDSPGSIINSVFVDTSFKQPFNKYYNFINSKLYSCDNYGSLKNNTNTMDEKTITITTKNSTIFNGYVNSFDDTDSGINNIDNSYSLINMPGFSINPEFNSIEASTGNDFSFTSDGRFIFTPSKPVDDESASVETKYSRNTQSFNYSNSTSASNTASKSRDNATATANKTTYSFVFDKNSAENNNYSSGYNYTFKTGTETNNLYDNFSTVDNTYTENNITYFNLGIFYIEHYFSMYTWAGQSNAVEASGTFKIEIEIFNKDNESVGKIYKETYKKFGGYWSKGTWSTKYIYSYINCQMCDDFEGYSDKFNSYFDANKGWFIISKDGVRNISKIKITFTGKTYANSTGANNCIGNVYISNVYRYENNTSWSSVSSTSQGSVNYYKYNPYTYYYKPSRYKVKGSTGNHSYQFGTDGILIIADDVKLRLNVQDQGLYVGNAKISY